MGAQGSTLEDNNSTSETSNAEAPLTQNEQPSSRIKDGVLESIHNFWMRREFTDLVVVVDKVEVRCHSFILCACCNYFARLMRSRQVTANEMKVYFNSFSKKTFQTILEALYTGKDIITSDNIIDVWYAAHELEISFLLTECEDFVLKYLAVENFAEQHKHAVILGSIKVSEATLELMQQNFEVFKESSEFLELSFKDLLKIVDSQDLIVSSEDVVIYAILKWVKSIPKMHFMACGEQEGTSLHEAKDGHAKTYEDENDEQLVGRTVYLEKLFSASRLSLVSPNCLAMLMECEIVQDHKEAKAAVNKAILYQLQVHARHGQWPPSAVHRNNSELQNIAVAGKVNGIISVFSLPHHSHIFQIKPSSGFSNCYISMTVFDNTLYALATQHSDCIIHGHTRRDFDKSFYNKVQTLPETKQESANHQVNIFSQLYVLNKQEWQKVTEVPGTEHILVPHGESVYFFQPITKKVIKLDRPFKGKTIQYLDDVPSASRIVSCLPLKRAILVFCAKPQSLDETTVHSLNTDTKTWSRLNNLKGPTQLVSFKDDDDTYILQENGAVSQIVDTHGGRVDFKFVDTLWCDDKHVNGCISLGHTLFISLYHVYKPVCTGTSQNTIFEKPEQKSSITGVFDTIKYFDYDFDFFLPAIVPKNIAKN